ncbi:50S ribosomal protein L13 [Vaginella massiliensis]|uniref:50S ribosomal protein L13 n=1 Tax=Vaginella massiliensis TaxID=1816680 RepID=UPI000838E7F3|nr:50S ribosomal protein L13 [Vaginella massiliensis]
MDTLSYKTTSANKQTAQKEWVVVDASDLSLGRLSSGIAKLIRGKHKANFTPHVDCGDNVIVLNAENIKLTGNKWEDKLYIRHTGYPGGQRSLTAKELYNRDPKRLIEKSVKGMLPKNKLGAALLKNLYIFEGAEHPHEAQKPTKIDINQYL